MIVKPIGPGLQGFDVNAPSSASEAAIFFANGFRFCIRYVPRTQALAAGNLTMIEMQAILSSGLSLGIVQHCPMAGWLPTDGLGTEYGSFAAEYCQQIGIPKGMLIWLDLEEVLPTATADQVIQYCKEWYAAVSEGGYLGGVYIGYQVILSEQQLYSALPFRNYWRAYNCDQKIPTRGYQIIQHTAKRLKGIDYDPNTSEIDDLGDSALFIFSS